MKYKNATGNLAVIAIMTLFCLTGTFHWLKHTHPPIHKRIEALRRGIYLR